MNYNTYRFKVEIDAAKDDWTETAWDCLDRFHGNVENAIHDLSNQMYDSIEIGVALIPLWQEIILNAIEDADWEEIATDYVRSIVAEWHQAQDHSE